MRFNVYIQYILHSGNFTLTNILRDLMPEDSPMNAAREKKKKRFKPNEIH